MFSALITNTDILKNKIRTEFELMPVSEFEFT
jgi:hypothetical protein